MPIWGCIGGGVIDETGPGLPDCGISGAGGFPIIPEDVENVVQSFNSAPKAGAAFNSLQAGSAIDTSIRRGEASG